MRRLIARNAHAFTRCARVIRVRKSAHLNRITRTFPPGLIVSYIPSQQLKNQQHSDIAEDDIGNACIGQLLGYLIGHAIESNADTHTPTLGLYMEETKVNKQILLSHVNQLHKTQICEYYAIFPNGFTREFVNQISL